MATWQYDLNMIPRSGAGTISVEAPADPGEAAVDVSACWRGTHLPDDIHSRLSRALGPAEASDGDLRWGTMDGDRVEIFFESGEPSEVWIRVDLRAPSLEFIEAIRCIASDADCVFVTLEGTILEPTKSAFFAAIAESPAAQFVRNPREFLANLDDGDLTPGH